MLLYARREGSTQIIRGDDSYKVAKDGTVEVPNELGAELLALHIDGQKMWEDGPERERRLAAEEAARRRDPGSAYDQLERIAEAIATPRKRPAKKATPAPRKAAAKKAAPAKKAAAPRKAPAKKA